MYKAQLEKMQVELGSEQKQRVEAQRKKRFLTREMDVFKGAHVKFLRNVKNTTNKLKATKIKLEKEKKQMNEEIESSQRSIMEITVRLAELKEQMETESQRLICHHENALKYLGEIEGQVKQTEEVIQAETPAYEAVKQTLAKRTEFYTKLREQQTQLTLELKTLTQQVQKKTNENASLSKKVLEAHNRLLARRENNKARLESDSNRLVDLEKQIYMNGCRLKAVLIENARLKWGIGKQEDEMLQICTHWKCVVRNKSRVQMEITNAQKIVKEFQSKEDDEIQTTLTRWKQNNLQLEQMKLTAGPIINALAEALDILA